MTQTPLSNTLLPRAKSYAREQGISLVMLAKEIANASGYSYESIYGAMYSPGRYGARLRKAIERHLAGQAQGHEATSHE
jgi:hypothetical protein